MPAVDLTGTEFLRRLIADQRASPVEVVGIQEGVQIDVVVAEPRVPVGERELLCLEDRVGTGLL